jgi:hypothetical protein
VTDGGLKDCDAAAQAPVFLPFRRRRRGLTFMSIERWIRLIAGTLIIVSLALAYFFNHNWLWLTLFVGVNLFQSALTGWCLMEDLLRKLGLGAPTLGSADRLKA